MRSLAAALTVAAAISFAPLAQAAVSSNAGVQKIADTEKKVHGDPAAEIAATSK